MGFYLRLYCTSRVTQRQGSSTSFAAECRVWRLGERPGSYQNFLHHLPIHIGQPEVAAGMPISQLLVIQPQQVQNRGMQVVIVNPILDREIAVVVGGSIAKPPF